MYPHLTLEHIKEIVYTPFEFTRKQMESGSLKTIRLKYFGIFTVYEGRARGMLNRMKKRFEANSIDPQEYFANKKMIESYLDEKD